MMRRGSSRIANWPISSSGAARCHVPLTAFNFRICLSVCSAHGAGDGLALHELFIWLQLAGMKPADMRMTGEQLLVNACNLIRMVTAVLALLALASVC
jgi:hypothetical protein